MSPTKWREAQRTDPDIRDVLKWKETGVTTIKTKPESAEGQLLLWEWPKLWAVNGVLYQTTVFPIADTKHQLQLPKAYREQAIKAFPDDFGHLWLDRTLVLLRDQFYWLGKM